MKVLHCTFSTTSLSIVNNPVESDYILWPPIVKKETYFVYSVVACEVCVLIDSLMEVAQVLQIWPDEM